MAYKVKHALPCVECGEPTFRRIRGKKLPVCLACAVERVEASVYQQQSKRGYAYAQWVAGMLKAANRASRTTAPSSNATDRAAGLRHFALWERIL